MSSPDSNTIIAKITNGLHVDIHVVKKEGASPALFDAALTELEVWLRQFNRTNKGCGGQQCIYFSRKTVDATQDTVMEISIYPIPSERREMLAGGILICNDHLLEVKLKPTTE